MTRQSSQPGNFACGRRAKKESQEYCTLLPATTAYTEIGYHSRVVAPSSDYHMLKWLRTSKVLLIAVLYYNYIFPIVRVHFERLLATGRGCRPSCIDLNPQARSSNRSLKQDIMTRVIESLLSVDNVPTSF